MPEFKAALVRHGFKNVITYIKSGNILFDSDIILLEAKVVCEDLIETDFGLKIMVGVITSKELTEAIERAPEWLNSDPKSKHNTIFVIPSATAEEVCVSVGESKAECECVAYYGNVIFWSAPLKTFSLTLWSKINVSPW